MPLDVPLDLVDTLCDLVRIPSVNPMGRDVTGEPYFETRVTDYLQQLFERLGQRVRALLACKGT